MSKKSVAASSRRFLRHASLAALAISSLGLAAPTLAAKTDGWGVPVTDVTPDPSIRYGRLPNGMRYAIMRNATPKGAASVRLRFEFGSIGESEKERGLAHFIEHMAFNGTTNVAEGDMVKILERQGLKFGPDTNAVTGFDSTTYMLDLPQTDAARLDTAFMLMREVASEVKFDAGAVDRERGVILGERRFRDTFGLRQVEDLLAFQMPATPYPNRLPIGTEEVLKTAPAATIKALYQRYYRPENATFVFVGDADPADIERRIKAKFSDWKGVGAAGAPLPRGSVDLKRPAAVDTFVDPAVATTATLISYRPWDDPADTLAERRRETLRYLGYSMFNRRMQRLINSPGSNLLYGAMSGDRTKDAALAASLTVAAKDGEWKQAVATAEQELRRALQHGFSKQELDVQIADGLGSLKTAVTQADARTNAALVNQILGTLDDPRFVTTPQFGLENFQRIAPTITVAEVNAEIRRLWSGSQPLLHVSSKQPIAEAALAEAFTASKKVAVAAPAAAAAVSFGYADFGAAGKIVEDKRIEDLGIRTMRFANNVRLNIKKTDFEKGKVNYVVRLAGGISAIGRERPGLETMYSMLSSQAATAKNSLEDLKILTAGRQVAGNALMLSDAIQSSGTTTATDLDMQMKLSAAYLTDPGFRPEADGLWTNIMPVIDQQLKATPDSVAQTQLMTVLTGNDYRFGVPPLSVLSKRSFKEARPLVQALAAKAPIEIGIVGDVDEAAAIAAVASSFGALPTRAAVSPARKEEAAFRADRSPVILTHAGGADQALVGAAWPTDDDADYRKVMGLSVLAQVMDLMLTDTVREKLGASYGVTVDSSMSDEYDDFGYVMVKTVVSPAGADAVDKAIAEAAAELRDRPISADLLDRARQPMLEQGTKNLRLNSYWAGFVDEAQTDAPRLDRIRQRQAILNAITPADIQALAKQYLGADQLRRFRILSNKAAAAPAPSAP